MTKKVVSMLIIAAMVLSMAFMGVSCNSNNSSSGGSGKGDEAKPDLTFENFNNAEYNVLCAAEQWKDAYVVEDQSDVLRAARYNMYNKIMDAYNIKLDHKIFNGYEAGMPSVRDALYQSVTSGSLDYDLITGGQAYVFGRISDGTLSNLNKTSIDFSKEWWCQFVNQELQISDVLPLATGYYSLTPISGAMVIFYNPIIADEYHLDNVYDHVRKGTWTYDTLKKYCQAVMTDVNGDQQFTLADDIIGLAAPEFHLAHMTVGFDYNICVHTEGENGSIAINPNVEKLFDITNRLHDLMDDKLTQSNADSNVAPDFAAGHSLMLIADLAGADAQEIRNMQEYTVVPMPKYDEKQTEYHTPVIADVCGIPLNVKDMNMSEYVMEALACYSFQDLRNVYLNLILKDKYSKDKDMEEMIDICLANPDTDFSYIAANLFGTDLYFCTVWKGRNITSWLKSYRKVYEKKLSDLYDGLIEKFN